MNPFWVNNWMGKITPVNKTNFDIMEINSENEGGSENVRRGRKKEKPGFLFH